MPAEVFPPCLNHGSRIDRSSLAPAAARPRRRPGQLGWSSGASARGRHRRLSAPRLCHALRITRRIRMVDVRAGRNLHRPGEPHRRLGGAGAGKPRRAVALVAPADHGDVVRLGAGKPGLAIFTAVEDAILLVAVLLAGVTIAQVPLWIAKKVFRWRLIRGADETVQSPQGPGNSIFDTSCWRHSCWRLRCRRSARCSRRGPSAALPSTTSGRAPWRRHRVQPAGHRSLYMGRTGIENGHGSACDGMAVLLRPSHVR